MIAAATCAVADRNARASHEAFTVCRPKTTNAGYTCIIRMKHVPFADPRPLMLVILVSLQLHKACCLALGTKTWSAEGTCRFRRR